MKEYVNIKGKSYPVNFGSWCHREFEKDTGTGMQDAFINNTASSAIDIVYHGLKDGARMDKQALEFDKPDLADLIDEEGEEARVKKETSAAAKIVNIWLKSMGYPELKYVDGVMVKPETEIENEIEEDTKKKNP